MSDSTLWLMQDAVAQANALASGQLTATKLLETTLEAIKAQQSLRCFLFLDATTALNAARQSDERWAKGRPLSAVDGLIVAVKDNIDVAAMPTTAGTASILHVAHDDAPVIAALRRAGAIILGKLNMDEVAIGTANNNPHHGQCLNPRFVGKVPGGSSGGSASAVAAGLCSMALGTDTMGSIRIPAACCGVVGFKPTYQAISNTGSISCANVLDHIGPLCRSLRDLPLWLPVLLHRTNWHFFSESHPQPFAMPRTELSQISVVLAERLTNTLTLSADVAIYYQHLITHLTNQLDLVTLQSLTVDCGKLRRAGLVAVEADISAQFSEPTADEIDILSTATRKLLRWVNRQSPVLLADAYQHLASTGDMLRQYLGTADVLILPTIPVNVPALCNGTPPGFADLTALANAAGMPALSLPVATANDGTTISLQLIAQPGKDASLISIATALQPLLCCSCSPLNTI